MQNRGMRRKQIQNPPPQRNNKGLVSKTLIPVDRNGKITGISNSLRTGRLFLLAGCQPVDPTIFSRCFVSNESTKSFMPAPRARLKGVTRIELMCPMESTTIDRLYALPLIAPPPIPEFRSFVFKESHPIMGVAASLSVFFGFVCAGRAALYSEMTNRRVKHPRASISIPPPFI